jgi:DNA-binding transcriptional MocR family regulator
MDQTISFTKNGSDPGDVSRNDMAVAFAMRRHVPHVVTWLCAQAEGRIWVVLPENWSVRDVLRSAEAAQVRLAPASDLSEVPDRAFEMYYAHLGEAEIEEGIRRLGACLRQHVDLAMRYSSDHPMQYLGT